MVDFKIFQTVVVIRRWDPFSCVNIAKCPKNTLMIPSKHNIDNKNLLSMEIDLSNKKIKMFLYSSVLIHTYLYIEEMSSI